MGRLRSPERLIRHLRVGVTCCARDVMSDGSSKDLASGALLRSRPDGTQGRRSGPAPILERRAATNKDEVGSPLIRSEQDAGIAGSLEGRGELSEC